MGDQNAHFPEFIAKAGVEELRRLAIVHGLDSDCNDCDELSALLLSFFSFANRRTVFVNELRDAFPSLRDEGDLIASLLESTDLCISQELLTQLADISDGSPPFTVFRPGQPLDAFAQIPGRTTVPVHVFQCALTEALCRCFGRAKSFFGGGSKYSPPCHLL
jgi:hypothetical protein